MSDHRTLSLADAIQAKQALEQRLLNAVRDFEANTGLTVNYITVETVAGHNMAGHALRSITGVKAMVDFP